MLVDNPIHQLETYECYWEDNSAVFINVTCGDSKHFVDVFRRDSDISKGSNELGSCMAGGTWTILIEAPGKSWSRMTVAILGNSILSTASFTNSPTSIVNLKWNEAISIIDTTIHRLQTFSQRSKIYFYFERVNYFRYFEERGSQRHETRMSFLL